MEEKAKNTILCLLKAIKCRADLSPNIKATKILNKKELERKVLMCALENNATERSRKIRNLYFDATVGKKVDLFQKNILSCRIEFAELEGILNKLRQESVLKDFLFKFDLPKSSRYEIILPENFESICNKYENKLLRKNDGLFVKKEHSPEDSLIVKLGKYKLEANKNTGAIKLNGCSNNLNPESQEFKALIKLMTNKDYKATYKELLSDNPTKVNKRNLGFAIRNLKEALGILPKKTAENKDIIKNIKNHGYMIGL